VIRPADATETVEAWRSALTRTDGPTVLALSRQKLPVLDRVALAPAAGARKGGYILKDSTGTPEIILIATGAEVHLALAAADKLTGEGHRARVVSLPSWELFDVQAQSYCDEVLPPGVRARVSIEAGATMGWHRYVGDGGATIGIDHFGASAPAERLFEEFGFSVDHVVKVCREVIGREGAQP
jgi:transketolase